MLTPERKRGYDSKRFLQQMSMARRDAFSRSWLSRRRKYIWASHRLGKPVPELEPSGALLPDSEPYAVARLCERGPGLNPVEPSLVRQPERRLNGQPERRHGA